MPPKKICSLDVRQCLVSASPTRRKRVLKNMNDQKSIVCSQSRVRKKKSVNLASPSCQLPFRKKMARNFFAQLNPVREYARRVSGCVTNWCHTAVKNFGKYMRGNRKKSQESIWFPVVCAVFPPLTCTPHATDNEGLRRIEEKGMVDKNLGEYLAVGCNPGIAHHRRPDGHTPPIGRCPNAQCPSPLYATHNRDFICALAPLPKSLSFSFSSSCPLKSHEPIPSSLSSSAARNKKKNLGGGAHAPRVNPLGYLIAHIV